MEGVGGQLCRHISGIPPLPPSKIRYMINIQCQPGLMGNSELPLLHPPLLTEEGVTLTTQSPAPPPLPQPLPRDSPCDPAKPETPAPVNDPCSKLLGSQIQTQTQTAGVQSIAPHGGGGVLAVLTATPASGLSCLPGFMFGCVSSEGAAAAAADRMINGADHSALASPMLRSPAASGGRSTVTHRDTALHTVAVGPRVPHREMLVRR